MYIERNKIEGKASLKRNKLGKYRKRINKKIKIINAVDIVLVFLNKKRDEIVYKYINTAVLNKNSNYSDLHFKSHTN